MSRRNALRRCARQGPRRWRRRIASSRCSSPSGLGPTASRACSNAPVPTALTNAMKHAPCAALEIQVAVDHDDLTIAVRNERDAAPSPLARTGSGLGLAGMRERLETGGGSLDAGPEPDGGFRVYARLPLDRGADTSSERQSAHPLSPLGRP